MERFERWAGTAARMQAAARREVRAQPSAGSPRRNWDPSTLLRAGLRMVRGLVRTKS